MFNVKKIRPLANHADFVSGPFLPRSRASRSAILMKAVTTCRSQQWLLLLLEPASRFLDLS
jgi:hypothetical protein